MSFNQLFSNGINISNVDDTEEVKINIPDNTVSYNLSLPPVQGNATTTLINDGNGVLSWGIGGGGGGGVNIASSSSNIDYNLVFTPSTTGIVTTQQINTNLHYNPSLDMLTVDNIKPNSLIDLNITTTNSDILVQGSNNVTVRNTSNILGEDLNLESSNNDVKILAADSIRLSTNATNYLDIHTQNPGNYSLTFPGSQGSVNQTLSNDGAGILSWVTPTTGINIASSISNTDYNLVFTPVTTGSITTEQINTNLHYNPSTDLLTTSNIRSLAPNNLNITSTVGSILIEGSKDVSVRNISNTSGQDMVIESLNNNVKIKAGSAIKISSDNTNYLDIHTQNPGNYSLTFPGSQGSTNQTLSNDGAGILSWVTPTTGTINGPVSSTLTAIPIWDNITGTLLKNSDLLYDNTTNTLSNTSDLTITTNTNRILSGNINTFRIGDGPMPLSNRSVIIGRSTSTVSGEDNVLIGENSGNNITTVTQNIAIGSVTLASVSTVGSDNVAIGHQAMTNATSTINNICIGTLAGNGNPGANNIVIGKSAANNASSSGYNQNVIIGASSCNGIIGVTAVNDVIIGYGAAPVLTSSNLSTIIGSQAGLLLTTGATNTAVGALSLQGVSTTANNTAIGYLSLRIGTGFGNTAIGASAGVGIGNVNNNVYIGSGCMAGVGGSSNVYIGQGTCVGTNTLTTSANNTYVGQGVQTGNVTGASTNNVVIGKGSFIAAKTTGSNNTIIGTTSALAITTGSYNCILGTNNLSALTTGSNNICIGSSSTLSSGSAYTTSESNNICIANTGVITDSGIIRIGTTAIQTSCIIPMAITGTTATVGTNSTVMASTAYVDRLVSNLTSSYGSLFEAGGNLGAAVVAGTYMTFLGHHTMVASGSQATTNIPYVFYFNTADYVTSNLPAGVQIRLSCTANTNATAPTGTFICSLYPLSSTAGAAGGITYTLGALVAGSSCATITTPAGSSTTNVVSSAFTTTTGNYVIGIVSSATTAVSSFTTFTCKLQITL